MREHPYYSAMAESSPGLRSRLTLRITGTDPQGAFDWCCGDRGLKRVSDDLEEHTEKPLGHTAEPFQSATKWSWRSMWQSLTKS